MVSLERCRSLIRFAARPNDAQLEQLRQDLYALAEVVLEAWAHSKSQLAAGAVPQKPGFGQLSQSPFDRLEQLPPGGRYELIERAAILEYDAGMTRTDAELEALHQLTNRHNNTVKAIQ